MNTKPIEVRGCASVWLTYWQLKHRTATGIISDIVSGRAGESVHTPVFSNINAKYDTGSEPWLKIGTAEIILSLTPPDGIAADEISALQAQLDAMRAQHHLAQKALLDRISKLSAITYGQ